MFEVEKFSEYVSVRLIPYASVSAIQAVDMAIKELQKTDDFNENYLIYTFTCIEELGTVRWNEDLEFRVTRLLREELIPSPSAHALVLQTLQKKKSIHLWRKPVDTSLLATLCNQPCKLREPRSAWPTEFNAPETPSIWVRGSAGWYSSSDLSIVVQEPRDFKDACKFSAIPKQNILLALKPKEVSFGILGQSQSFASFPHDVDDPDFIESYVLPSSSIIVRVGKRNTLTGGLFNESMFSFIMKQSPEPHVLSTEEELLVEGISSPDSTYKWTFDDTSTVLTGWNDLGTGTSKVIYKSHELELNTNMVLATLGHPGDFWAVFYNGDIHHYRNERIVEKLSLDVPLTHAVLKFKH
jgi:hypothetical protein